jgi:hypothetical protein
MCTDMHYRRAESSSLFMKLRDLAGACRGDLDFARMAYDPRIDESR